MSEFSKGLKVHKIRTTIGDIEHKHSVANAGSDGKLPYTHIFHDKQKNTYSIHRLKRDRTGSPIPEESHHQTHTEEEFLHHVVKLHKDEIPPNVKEASIKTKPNGHVDIHLGHE